MQQDLINIFGDHYLYVHAHAAHHYETNLELCPRLHQRTFQTVSLNVSEEIDAEMQIFLADPVALSVCRRDALQEIAAHTQEGRHCRNHDIGLSDSDYSVPLRLPKL